MKKIKNISEKNIIHKYLSRLNYNKIESFKFKNDAGYIKVPKNKKLIITNDTIIESTDFFKNDPPESIANKIIIYNLSDISSMGAYPYSYTLSLCLPSNINDIWLSKFTKKLNSLQKKYSFFLIGGDLSRFNKIIVSSNFFGFAPKNKILNRTGAKINDDIWITGNLGESSIGLACRNNKIKLDNTNKKYYLKKYLFPDPCLIGSKINYLATSAIDISDGFYGDLENLVNDQKIGAYIHSSLIPFSNKSKNLILNKTIKLNYLLSAGDDYELLFTSNPKNSLTISKFAKKSNIKITKVGSIIEKKGVYLDGKKVNNANKSYQHFF